MQKIYNSIRYRLWAIKFNIKCYQDPYCALDFAKGVRKCSKEDIKYVKEENKKEFLILSNKFAINAENWYTNKTGKPLPKEHIEFIRNN